jgi:hypothetical protein
MKQVVIVKKIQPKFGDLAKGALVNSDLFPDVGELWERQFVQTIDSLR